MLKFLLILGIIVYLVYKVGSFFFRAGAAAKYFRDFQEQQRRNMNANPGKDKKGGKFNGGDYIDYEEVK